MRDLLRHSAEQRPAALYGDAWFRASGCQLGTKAPLPQPFVVGTRRIWLAGEIYNRQAFRSAGSGPDPGDAGALLELIGPGCDFTKLDRVDGIYAAVVYDSRDATVHLMTDRYGLGYLYWHRQGDNFAWASESKAMLALPDFEVQIDRSSATTFLERGQLEGDRSWFRDVELVPPAAVLSWDLRKRSMSQQHYWSSRRISPLEGRIDERELADEVGRRFRAAVAARARPGERLGVTLSGGLDSRAVLAALPPGDRPPLAMTFGRPGCPDWTIAARAARVAGARHHFLEIDSESWLQGRTEGVWWSDGELSLLHMHGLGPLAALRSECDAVLSGFVGDAVAGGSLLKEGGLPEFEVIMGRGRRFTMQGIRLFDNLMPQRLPFMANDLIDLLMAVPARLRANSTLYRRMLLQQFPEYFRKIPWQRTGLSIARPAALVSASLCLRAWTQRGRRVLGRAGFALTDRDDYTNYAGWLREGAGRAMATRLLLDSNALLTEYVSRGDVRELWENHLAGRDHSEQLGRYVTLEIWLRQLSGGALRPGPP